MSILICILTSTQKLNKLKLYIFMNWNVIMGAESHFSGREHFVYVPLMYVIFRHESNFNQVIELECNVKLDFQCIFKNYRIIIRTSNIV